MYIINCEFHLWEDDSPKKYKEEFILENVADNVSTIDKMMYEIEKLIEEQKRKKKYEIQ